jgi:hypothetical protein
MCFMVERLQRGFAHGRESLLQITQFLMGERDVWFWTAAHFALYSPFIVSSCERLLPGRILPLPFRRPYAGSTV